MFMGFLSRTHVNINGGMHKWWYDILDVINSAKKGFMENMENFLQDASNCLYAEVDDTLGAVYSINGVKKVNLSLLKHVPMPIMNDERYVVGSMFKVLRIGCIDLDMEQAQDLVERLTEVLEQNK